VGRSFGLFSVTREGATEKAVKAREEAEVSIHAPVKVRHTQKQENSQIKTVSIHAPVKVRPYRTVNESRRPFVSIHAPVKVRRVISPFLETTKWFQFTHP